MSLIFISTTFVLWKIKPTKKMAGGTGRDVIEKEVNKHPHSTKSSLMEAMARAMKDVNEDHLLKAYCRLGTRIE
ncbi:hypothetical protein ACTXT7_013179 [Hymenolepis weldensis]